MAYLHFDNVGIAAMAGAVPEFVQKINTDPMHPRAEYIKNFMRQTGFKQRHISVTEQTCTDYGFTAINLALERAGWTAQELDALVFVSQTPDFNPGTGNGYVMHNHLKMRDDAFVMDIAQGCAGFPFGLSVCASYLQQPGINRLAMVSGDTMWPIYPNKKVLLAQASFLPGEGSVAVLFEKRCGVCIDIGLWSDGSGYHLLYDPSFGARHAWRDKRGILPNGEKYMGGSYMDGLEITIFSTGRVVESMREFMGHMGTAVQDYDAIILHQANKQIVRTIGKRLKAAPGQIPTTIETLANTNVASAPLTLVDAFGGGEGKKHLLLCAFGIGLAWGVADFEIDANIIVPLAISHDRFDDDFLKPFAK